MALYADGDAAGAYHEIRRHEGSLPPPLPVWIYTDSQYVVGTVKRIEMGAHKRANWDLVGRVKVKAHRALEEAEGYEDMYRILGKTKADEAANALHLVQSQTIADNRKSIQEHDTRQIEALPL